MKDKALIYLLGAVILGLAGLVVYKKFLKKRPAPQPVAQTTQPKAPIALDDVDIKPSKEELKRTETYVEEIKAKRSLFRAQMVLGNQKMKVSRNGDQVSLLIKLEPQVLWCQGGDVDVMGLAEDPKEEHSFLLTVESMTGEKVFWRQSLSHLGYQSRPWL